MFIWPGPHRQVVPRLQLLDALSDVLAHVPRLVQQVVHPLLDTRRVALGAEEVDIGAEFCDVAAERQEFIDEACLQLRELGVVAVPAPGLEGRELIE